MPLRQYSPVDVQTSPSRAMKKFVALQVATLPLTSSISASSAPAFIASMSAITSCSLLWQLSRWSRTSGPGLRVCDVWSATPVDVTIGSATLCSAMMTTLGPPTRLDGC